MSRVSFSPNVSTSAIRCWWVLHLAAVFSAMTIAGAASAVSPWTPEAGSLNTTATLIYQEFDSLYMKTTKVNFDPDMDGDADEIGQFTASMGIEYGIFDFLAFDTTLGYTRTYSSTLEKVADIDLKDGEGLDDVEIGLTLSVVDEFEWEQWYVPSVALRAGAVIKGSYKDTFFPASAGDKGTGWEIELALGKVLESGFGVSSSAGYRDRDNGVPPDVHYRADAFYQVPDVIPGYFDGATVSLAYDLRHSTKGVDLGPTFTPDKAGKLKEREQIIEMGLGLQDVGGRYYSLFYGRTVDGRNTGEKDIFGISITLPWNVPHL